MSSVLYIFLPLSRSQDIVDDIQQECSSHGTVLSVVVPRAGEGDASRAVGKAHNFQNCNRAAVYAFHCPLSFVQLVSIILISY